MGAAKLREHLPRLITAIEDAGLNVLWVTDPMHGNTIKTDNGFKTRPFEAVRDEIMAFFEVHEKMGYLSWWGSLRDDGAKRHRVHGRHHGRFGV